MGLRVSSLEGGFGLTPFTYVLVGRVTVEKAVLVDSGERTLVSENTRRNIGQGRGREEKIKVSNDNSVGNVSLSKKKKIQRSTIVVQRYSEDIGVQT